MQTDAQLIENFIKTKGVTKCPDGFALGVARSSVKKKDKTVKVVLDLEAGDKDPFDS